MSLQRRRERYIIIQVWITLHELAPRLVIFYKQLTKTEILVYPVFLTYNIALIAIIGSNSTNIDHSHNHKPF